MKQAYDFKNGDWTDTVASISGALDANNNFFPLDSMAQHINRDGSGNILSIVATNGANTWTQTYTYTNGSLTDISSWVKA